MKKESKEKKVFGIAGKLFLSFAIILLCLILTSGGLLTAMTKTNGVYQETLQFSVLISETLQKVQTNEAMITADLGKITDRNYAKDFDTYQADAQGRIAENEQLLETFLASGQYKDEQTQEYVPIQDDINANMDPRNCRADEFAVLECFQCKHVDGNYQ